MTHPRLSILLGLALMLSPVVMPAASTAVAQRAQPSRLPQKYVDAERGYTVHYPDTYEMQDGADADTKIFAAPQEGPLDIFRENLTVMVRRYDRDVTSAEARQALQKEMQAQGATLIDSDDRSKVAGKPAHRFVWSMRLGGFDLVLAQLVCPVKDRIYVLTFTVEKGQERRYRPVADAMANAFEINYPPAPSTPTP